MNWDKINAEMEQNKALFIGGVSKRFRDKHEFSKYMTNNKPKQIWLDEFSKEEPYIIIDRYYEDKFIGVYNKQGVIISGKQDDFTWLFKEGMYINVC